MPGSHDRCSGHHRAKTSGFAPPPDLAWVSRRGNSTPLEDFSPLCRRDRAGLTRMWPPMPVLDPLLRIYFSESFTRAMDEHVKTEFPKLRDMLHRRG
jgi:hypothetical protein